MDWDLVWDLILVLSLTHIKSSCESAFLLLTVLAGGAVQDNIMVSFCLSKWEREKESINIKICPWACQNMLQQSLQSLTTRAAKKKKKKEKGPQRLCLSWRKCKGSESCSLSQLCLQINAYKQAWLYSGSVSVLQRPPSAWLHWTAVGAEWRISCTEGWSSGSVLRDKEPASLKHTPCFSMPLFSFATNASSYIFLCSSWACLQHGLAGSEGSLACLFFLPDI